MARSIGRARIKKLKQIVKDQFYKYKKPYSFELYDHELLEQSIKNNIPSEWYNIWESAYSEIERIVSDEISNLKYGKN